MAVLSYLRVLLIISSITSALRLSCDPAEELKSYTFTCDGISNSDTIGVTWKKNDILFATCNSNICYLEKGNPDYNISYLNQASILTISNVTRQNGGLYVCNGAGEKPNCNLTVYARPESVSCQQPKVQTDGNSIMVNCTVIKTYPRPYCKFSWFINGTEKNVAVKASNISESGNPSYFNAVCSLTLPVQDLSFESHVFTVNAYPNVTGKDSDTMYGRNSSTTSAVLINYPTVQLESCPLDDYILEGTNYSCTCRETANTFLSANTTFSSGSTIVSSGPGIATYNFTARRNMENLTCQAKLLTETSNTVTYTPQVAYGPDSVSFNVTYNQKNADVIDWCEKTQPVWIIAECTVPGNDVSPGVNFQFNINGTSKPRTRPNSTTLNYDVTNAGQLSVQCIASNSVYTTKSVSSQSQIIQVREPPASPPVIASNATVTEGITSVTGSQLEVLEGINRISCQVDGGYPQVSSVSVDCGDMKRNTSVGNVVFVDVTMTREKNGSNCSCTATHNSSCYFNNNTVVKLILVNSSNSEQTNQDVNVGAIVGGIVAGILVIATVVVIVFVLRRKGILGKGDETKDSNTKLFNKSSNDPKANKTNARGNSANSGAGERPESDVVVIDNSGIYNLEPDTVVFDNSDIYNMNRKSDEVVIDNSDIYNMGRADLVIKTKGTDTELRNYSDIVPTITSATAAPRNTVIKSPYEDVCVDQDNNINTVAPTATKKPKPVPKQKSGEQKQGKDPQTAKKKAKSSALDQTYATVNKSGKNFVISQDNNLSSEIPDKKSAEKNIVKEKKDKKGPADKDVAEPNQDASYANNGFTDPDDGINVYANANDIKNH